MQTDPIGNVLRLDPIGDEDGMNLYRFVTNDPANMIDPTGLLGCDFHCEPLPGGGWGNPDIPGSGFGPLPLPASWGVELWGGEGNGSGGNEIVVIATIRLPSLKGKTCAALRAAATDVRNGNRVYAGVAGAGTAYYFARHAIHFIHFLRGAAIFVGAASSGGVEGAEAGAVGGPWGAAAGTVFGVVAGGALAYTEATGYTTIGADTVDSFATAGGCK